MTDVESLLDLAEEALDRGEAEQAIELCRQALTQDKRHAGALYLMAEAHREMADLTEAEARYRDALRIAPEHAPSWTGLGATLFDQLRFDEARTAILRAIREDELHPDAYWWRALLRERRLDFLGAARDYRRAGRLDPEAFPMPIGLDDATVEAVVEECVRAAHPSIREYLASVAFLLEEVPDEDVLRGWDPPMPPAEILGCFTGPTVADGPGAWMGAPPSIVLYRRNLQRIAHDRERMIQELRVTVLHEVGHFLGLDEEDLEERGLD